MLGFGQCASIKTSLCIILFWFLSHTYWFLKRAWAAWDNWKLWLYCCICLKIERKGPVQPCPTRPCSPCTSLWSTHLLSQPNSTSTQHQLELEWLHNGLDHHPTHETPYGTSRQHRKLNFGVQPYFDPTRWIMEDYLNIFENGRRLQFFQWKTTSILFLVTYGAELWYATFGQPK